MSDAQREPGHRIRILFILPSLVRAGAETQTVTLLNAMSAERFSKFMFTFEAQRDLEVQIDKDNIRYFHTRRDKKFDVNVMRSVARIIDEHKIDVVYCSLQIALFYGWCGVRLASRRAKIVLGVHTTINRSGKLELFDRLLYKWLMRSCDSVIFVCRSQRDYWVKKFPFLSDNCSVVHNGIDTDRFTRGDSLSGEKNLRDSLRIDSNAFVIAHVAGFRPEKGHLNLVNAFEKVLGTHPSAMLMFVGDGSGRSVVESVVNDRQLSHAIRFVGAVADVRPFLSIADISVIASVAVETFSIAMLESLAMNVPMVAMDIGGTREAVIDGVSGLLVRPGDLDGLVASINYMLEHPAERRNMAFNARELVVSNFTVKKMTDDASALFEQVVREID
jgi:glycosyltransferase involved in cell wall biosynthesis